MVCLKPKLFDKKEIIDSAMFESSIIYPVVFSNIFEKTGRNDIGL